MKTLSFNTHPAVTHIIHIADLHVRIGDRFNSRSDEYAHVFDRLVTDLSELQCVKDGTALVVLCGDVAHSKCRLETSGTMVLFEWINKMLSIAPMLVISGNHDFLQNDPSITDSIDVLVKPYQHTGTKYPIVYMKETDHYRWENIGFGVCSCKDTLRKFNTFGVVDQLPAFPDPSKLPDDLCKIALFHGSITQSALPNGRSVDSLTSGYPLEWFRGYTAALLGDVHLQQVKEGLDGTLKWGYPGSLVAQDTGETTYGHGYLLWDVSDAVNPSVTAHHITNIYGDITIIRNDHDDVMVRLSSRQTLPFKEAIQNPCFPIRPKLRIIGKSDGVIDMLETYGIIPSRLKVSINVQSPISGCNDTSSFNDHMVVMGDLNTPAQWERYVKENAPDIDAVKWIYDPKQLLMSTDLPVDAQTINKIKVRNKSIQDMLDTYDNQVQSGYRQKHTMVLKRMDWSYLMCFGENNHMDFESVEGGISLLNGANATGKSSYIDVLCIALYGEPTSSRSDTTEIKMNAGIIHAEKPPMANSGVKLLFDMDGEKYEIHRTFAIVSSHSTKQNKVTTIHRIVEDSMFIIADGAPMVNAWINDRFGSLADLLMSTVLCQMDNTSFFFQSATKQKELIDRSLNLGTIASFQNIIEEAIKAYKYVCNDIDALRRGNAIHLSDGSGSLEDVTNRIDALRTELADAEENIAIDANKSSSLLMKIGNTDVDMSISYEDAQYQLEVHGGSVITDDERQHIQTMFGALSNKRTNLLKSAAALKFEFDDGFVSAAAVKAKKVADRTISLHALSQPPPANVSHAFIDQHQADYDKWCETADKHMLADPKVAQIEIDMLKLRRAALEQELKQIHLQPAVKPVNYKNEKNHKQLANIDDLHSASKAASMALDDINLTKPNQGRSRTVLEKIMEEYALWSKRQNAHWISNVVEVRSRCNTLQAECAALVIKADVLPTIAQPQVKRPAVAAVPSADVANTDALDYMKERLSELMSTIVPQRPKAGLVKWKAELAAWKAMQVPLDDAATLQQLKATVIADVNRKQQLQAVVAALTVDIQNLKNIPFNSECWACCTHHKPSQDMLVEKQTALVAAEDELGAIQKDWQPEQMEMLNNSIRNREKYESLVDYMTAEEACWKEAAVEWKADDARLKEVVGLKAGIAMVSWHLYDEFARELREVRDERDAKQAELLAVSTFCQQFDDMQRQIKGVDVELEWCALYEQWQTEHDRLSQQAFTAACSLWTAWNDSRERVEAELGDVVTRLAELNDFINAFKTWEVVMARIEEQQEMLEKWETWRETMDVLEIEGQKAYLRQGWAVSASSYDDIESKMTMINSVDGWQKRVWSHELNTVDARLAALRERANSLTGEIGELTSLAASMVASSQKDSDYKCVLVGLQETVMRLERFQTVFVGNKTSDGFKSDIYKRNVIPLIENAVNGFLRELDDIQLKITFTNGKFIYNVQDRGCCPAFDHASGYQKFLIGLAMRSTLSSIGAVGQSVKHLFIDEGFVSCDMINLLKVRDILIEVMRIGGYRSVILMSHQEAIREVAQSRIDIERDGGKFSRIRHGRTYPKFKRGTEQLVDHPECKPLKRRGRPPKAK